MHVISRILQRIKLFFCKDKELYSSLYQIIGFYPRRVEVYRQALSHKSVRVIDKYGTQLNNERLEFLGDAILSAVISEILYTRFSTKQEGFLTVVRSKIVQREMLNKLSEQIGLDKLVNDSTHHSSQAHNIHGNAFEALMGAIYLDRGYASCLKFVQERLIGQQYFNLDEIALEERNFKSRLLEWSQKNRFRISFESEEVKIKGEPPQFRSRVLVEELIGGIGMGSSKKASQQAAAEDTLKLIRKKRTFYRNVIAAKQERTKLENAEKHQTSLESECENLQK